MGDRDYEWFNRLRRWREREASNAAIPVYRIFNNNQLIEMVKNRVTTKAGLEKIPGLGDGRLEKYGESVLQVLREMFAPPAPPSSEPKDETSQTPF